MAAFGGGAVIRSLSVFKQMGQIYGLAKRVFAALDCTDRLTAHSDIFSELLLRHLTMMESQLPNSVRKCHGSPRHPKSNKLDDMSKILDMATRIFDQ